MNYILLQLELQYMLILTFCLQMIAFLFYLRLTQHPNSFGIWVMKRHSAFLYSLIFSRTDMPVFYGL